MILILLFVGAIFFAYFANSSFVFRSSQKKEAKKILLEIKNFFAGRLMTFFIEMVLLYLLLGLGLAPILAKFFLFAVTAILNFLISKFLVFR